MARKPKQPVKNPPHRPSMFRPQYVQQAEVATSKGMINADLAELFGVTPPTIFHWRKAHPEFDEAILRGKAIADDRVEKSLYKRAMGYRFAWEEVTDAPNGTTTKRGTTHVTPSDTAAIFWLKNRRPSDWKDRHEHDIGGKDGKPIEIVTFAAVAAGASDAQE